MPSPQIQGSRAKPRRLACLFRLGDSRRTAYSECAMQPVRRAVIDVGTNSIKLLVADVDGRDVHPVHEASHQTRLGKGFYATHRLQPDTIAHSAEAVAEFTRTAREKNAKVVRVIATSAARDAVNPGDLTSAIERAAGLKVEIISGAREAEWAFRGVTTDPELVQAPLLLLDVGGGSAQFILGQGPRTHFACSFQLGAVRLLEKFPHHDPPAPSELTAVCNWVKHFLSNEVRPELEPALRRETASRPAGIQLVGTGGTSSILARMEAKLDRYDRKRLEATRLSLEQVIAHRQRLWRLPLVERKEIVGLPKSRADVILTGILIYELVMAEFGFPQLRVSTRGLRFAAVMD
jgi:exopolyphosphatase / guanosine-5'-triphosphate,3'-diphosphate pyrophosphatase